RGAEHAGVRLSKERHARKRTKTRKARKRTLRVFRVFRVFVCFRGYRNAAFVAGTPSVLADASATSNSSFGYPPRTSVAKTAMARAIASEGFVRVSKPIVSFFKYMKTTMGM